MTYSVHTDASDSSTPEAPNPSLHLDPITSTPGGCAGSKTPGALEPNTVHRTAGGWKGRVWKVLVSYQMYSQSQIRGGATPLAVVYTRLWWLSRACVAGVCHRFRVAVRIWRIIGGGLAAEACTWKVSLPWEEAFVQTAVEI